MAELTDWAMTGRASVSAAATKRATAGATASIAPLEALDAAQWRALSERAVEPNGYYLADWMLAVNDSAPGRTGASALAASTSAAAPRLIGLMPVTSLWRALRIPLPALASADPYGTLCTPLLEAEHGREAAALLMQAARAAGAHALVLRDVSLEGPTLRLLTEAALADGLQPTILQGHRRAALDATTDAETLLRHALGGKKLKDLRRQRHRLAEHGPVCFRVAADPKGVVAATEIFLELEASGWKARRGTALLQTAGDAAFIRRATQRLAARGQCEVVSLHAGAMPVAAGIVLRHQSRAFFFKLGVDERFAKFSPGVQLTLDLTRHLCADPMIASADSTAAPNHPMIDPIWRGRFAVGDVMIPLRRKDPIVATIYAALLARQRLQRLARQSLRLLRERS